MGYLDYKIDLRHKSNDGLKQRMRESEMILFLFIIKHGLPQISADPRGEGGGAHQI